MDIRKLKNDKRFFWTNHSKGKLLQYSLAPSVIKKTINRPERVEEGIAPKTTALMIRKDTRKSKREIWVMLQKMGQRKKIISAWIYPGVSPKGKEIFIPDDALNQL